MPEPRGSCGCLCSNAPLHGHLHIPQVSSTLDNLNSETFPVLSTFAFTLLTVDWET
ncbi:hypothetical protein BT96DRAFT_924230 [Gymnopus androsaceus JB14]|uniref:Uncharacterized protein n=1 Tax=Gymnopus androsaceus JB14 TaxID=1447944 RepID=A0A6A4H4R7_9AGAR|nr:hypothetical protein BT96DRAFT_924230 [Gymnopus androsaceus JB14]